MTSLSADTHKYGYALKGTSVLTFRDKSLRNSQYFFQTDWSGGKYCSPGMEGSRSGGLLAATWASMVHLGREGYRRYAQAIFETAEAMREAVCSHPELRILGEPSFLFSFTAEEFDVYHVNDFMRERGWRFNGQQYPNALHMAVTRPQTQPGVSERFAADLADAVAYARDPGRRSTAFRGHLRWGGRWHDRRGRRGHQGGHGRADGRPAVDPRRRLSRAAYPHPCSRQDPPLWWSGYFSGR